MKNRTLSADNIKVTKKSFVQSSWFDIIIKIVVFSLLIFITFSLILGTTTISSDYMLPNIKHKDIVIYSRIDTDYLLQDVLVYIGPNGETYVGRVVGFPGDKISINENGTVFRNGFPETDNNIYVKSQGLEEFYTELKENEYYVLSDNRQYLADSRTFGPINKTKIKGTIITIVRRFGI